MWKLKQELKMMETRLSEMSTRGSSNEMSSGQQPSNPRDSSSSVMSGLSNVTGVVRAATDAARTEGDGRAQGGGAAVTRLAAL